MTMKDLSMLGLVTAFSLGGCGATNIDAVDFTAGARARRGMVARQCERHIHPRHACLRGS